MQFGPPGSAILKGLSRSPHPTPFAQPTRFASSQVRSPKQRQISQDFCQGKRV